MEKHRYSKRLIKAQSKIVWKTLKEVGFLSALEVLYFEKEKVDGPDALLKAIAAQKWTFLVLHLGSGALEQSSWK